MTATCKNIVIFTKWWTKEAGHKKRIDCTVPFTDTNRQYSSTVSEDRIAVTPVGMVIDW